MKSIHLIIKYNTSPMLIVGEVSVLYKNKIGGQILKTTY